MAILGRTHIAILYRSLLARRRGRFRGGIIGAVHGRISERHSIGVTNLPRMLGMAMEAVDGDVIRGDTVHSRHWADPQLLKWSDDPADDDC